MCVVKVRRRIKPSTAVRSRRRAARLLANADRDGRAMSHAIDASLCRLATTTCLVIGGGARALCRGRARDLGRARGRDVRDRRSGRGHTHGRDGREHDLCHDRVHDKPFLSRGRALYHDLGLVHTLCAVVGVCRRRCDVVHVDHGRHVYHDHLESRVRGHATCHHRYHHAMNDAEANSRETSLRRTQTDQTTGKLFLNLNEITHLKVRMSSHAHDTTSEQPAASSSPSLPAQSVAFSSSNPSYQDEVRHTTSSSTKKRELSSPFESYFSIAASVSFIQSGNFRRIALQFPDELLAHARSVSRELKRRLPLIETYILADTSYGSCCVDEIAAEHAQADAIIHYGHACLSQTRRLPVCYVFGQETIDVAACAQHIKYFMSDAPSDVKALIVMFELTYEYAIPQLQAALLSAPSADTSLTERMFIFASVDKQRQQSAAEVSARPSACTERNVVGYHIALPLSLSLSECVVCFIGSADSPTLLNVMLNLPSMTFLTFDPTSSAPSLQSVSRSISRTLSRRYYLMEKTKNADIIGIVVGTLGVNDYLSIINALQSLILRSAKKSYLYVVGKINEPKLANFAEIDIFVLVACPMNSIIDTTRYYRDVITPFELEMALNGRAWDGDYSTDFQSVLSRLQAQEAIATTAVTESKSGASEADVDDDASELDESVRRIRFDPISGKLRSTLANGTEQSTTALSTVSNDNALVTVTGPNGLKQTVTLHTSAEVRRTRGLWSGLDHKQQTEKRSSEDGEDKKPIQIEEGRSGIASRYTTEIDRAKATIPAIEHTTTTSSSQTSNTTDW